MQLTTGRHDDEPVRVIDGDGLHTAGQSIRLWGNDAPEMRQECSRDGILYACGVMARDALAAFVGASAPVCETVETDRYGREVARCEVGGEDLAALMVRSGWALDWPRYSGGAYALDQDVAERAGRGLWQGFFAVPWEWRREN
jgi:endonuclease YncB( thermonuclease family)